MIRGHDFQRLAETWITGAAEAEWRSAVSRAYYGAFHVARQLLQDLGFQVPRGDQAHAYLWLRLSNCGDPNVQVAGSDLNTLRPERNRSDYDVSLTLRHRDANLQVQAANRIIHMLDAVSKNSIRQTITNAMRVYERDVLKIVTWAP